MTQPEEIVFQRQNISFKGQMHLFAIRKKQIKAKEILPKVLYDPRFQKTWQNKQKRSVSATADMNKPLLSLDMEF